MTRFAGFEAYVAGFAELLAQGRGAAMDAPMPAPLLPPVAADAPVCLLFSPHPDDEAITGGLPWRLRRQDAWRVINVAVTLGSRRERRSARWHELSACCAHMGFGLVSASGEPEQGLERVTPQAAQTEPAHWALAVGRIAALLMQHRPQLIVCPHANDGHAAHIGTHLLVMDALRQIGGALRPHLLLSEYWNTQPDPGLMVELSTPDVAQLVAALSLHAGEVARNPYHLTLPAWCMDAVRRGAERVGAPGADAPGFAFATLYGWRRWNGREADVVAPRLLALSASPAALFA